MQVSLPAPNKKEVAVRETSVRVNDGKYHVVRLVRTGAEVTLQVDDLQVRPTKHLLTMFLITLLPIFFLLNIP